MAEDYTSGTVPLKTDPERVLLVKILQRMAFLTLNGAHPPLPGDTERQLLVKILRTLDLT